MTTAYPIALQIASEAVDDDNRATIARLIYSYIVRRALSGLTAKNLNRVFQALCHRFATNRPSVDELVKFFAERSGDSTRFPNDEEFRQGILTQPAYHVAPGSRIKDVLWELELRSRTNFSEKVSAPSGLQTEHVLPVTWTADWPLFDGAEVKKWSDDPRASQREQALHTLGNLTLITGSLNASSSNLSFAQKKARYAEHTSLFLNRWFSKAEEWHEVSIRERGEHLARQAVTVWPYLPFNSA